MKKGQAKIQHDLADARINETKKLDLDARIKLVEKGMMELNLLPTPESAPKLAQWLRANGYEPMMFSAACSVIQSRKYGKGNK